MDMNIINSKGLLQKKELLQFSFNKIFNQQLQKQQSNMESAVNNNFCGNQDEDSKLIQSNKFIILVDNRNQQRLIKLSTHRKFNWRKTQINLEQLKKQPYYQLLEVGNNSLKRIQFENPDDLSENQQNQENNGGKDQEVRQNNKEIYTLEEAQKLQMEDIQKMKKQKRPEQLINQLVQNNQQFQKRTAYSKAKYLKKKKNKYIFNIYAEPVSLENIHDYYFKNDIKWIGGIRWDMFALLLLHGGPYRRVLMSQKTKGILLGAMITKGADSIDFVSFQEKNVRALPIAEQLNIQNDEREKVSFVNWEGLKSQFYKNKRFDNFLLLGNYDFSAITDQLEELKILGSNTSISFFCLSSEPILECFNNMRKNHKNYLNVKIYDSWCRQYQVLKNRTHPLMYMDSRSGYLLTAIRVSQK